MVLKATVWLDSESPTASLLRGLSRAWSSCRLPSRAETGRSSSSSRIGADPPCLARPVGGRRKHDHAQEPGIVSDPQVTPDDQTVEIEEPVAQTRSRVQGAGHVAPDQRGTAAERREAPADRRRPSPTPDG